MKCLSKDTAFFSILSKKLSNLHCYAVFSEKKSHNLKTAFLQNFIRILHNMKLYIDQMNKSNVIDLPKQLYYIYAEERFVAVKA